MSLDRHSGFDVFGDVPACIAGTIGVVDWDRYVDPACLEIALFDKASVDGAACAAAIQEALGTEGLRSGDRV